jgi:hypothetical protein
MRYESVVSCALAVMALAGCATRDHVAPRADITEKQAVEVQARVEKYLYSSVVPRLRRCWATLEGSGSLRVTHEYARENTNWVARSLVLDSSSLPDSPLCL